MLNFLKIITEKIASKVVYHVMFFGFILFISLVFINRINTAVAKAQSITDTFNSLVNTASPSTEGAITPVADTMDSLVDTTTPSTQEATTTTDTTDTTINTEIAPQPQVQEPAAPEQISPVVTEVISPILFGSYKSGVVPIKILFSEPVIVSGTPQLILSTGTPATTAIDYKFGFNNSLLFLYHITTGNYNPHLDYSSSDSLVLNGGNIKDKSGNEANLTLPNPGSLGSLSVYSNIVIDTGK